MDVAELSMLLEAMEPREVSQDEFMEAVAKVKTVKKLAQEQQLVLYGLFKQYTAGDVSGPEPEQSDFVAKAKWFDDFDLLSIFIAQSLIKQNLHFTGTHGKASSDFRATTRPSHMYISCSNCSWLPSRTFPALLRWTASV